MPSLATFKYVYTGLNTNLKYDKNEEAELQESLLSNSSFEEEDLSDYTFNDFIKRRQDTPKTGKYAMNFYNGANDYTTGIERKITLPAGTYQFSAQIQGGDTNGSEDIYAFARAEAVNVQSQTSWLVKVADSEIELYTNKRDRGDTGSICESK